MHVLDLYALAALFGEGDKPASPTLTIFIGVALIVLGLVLLVAARNQFRQAGVIGRLRNTSLRDLAPGLVRISGKAEGDAPFIGPITGTPCYSFEAKARECSGEGTKASWRDVQGLTERRPFSFSDGTAVVLVDPNGSEWDLNNTLDARLEPSRGFSCHLDPELGLPAPSEKELRYLLRADWKQPRQVSMTAMADKPEERERKRHWWMPSGIEIEGLGSIESLEVSGYSLSETCVLPERQYSIVGTCEAIAGADGPARWLIRQEPKTPFLLSSKPPERMAGAVRKRAFILSGVAVIVIAFAILLLLERNSWVSG